MQDYLLVQEKKVLLILKAKCFQQKLLSQHSNIIYLLHLNKKEQAKKSKFELYADLNRKLIEDETNIKTEIFIEYFGFQNPSSYY